MSGDWAFLPTTSKQRNITARQQKKDFPGHKRLLGKCISQAAPGSSILKKRSDGIKPLRQDDYAQFWLATAYINGKGVPKDFNEAMRWYRRAAGNGLPEAQMFLAESYLYDKRLKQDPAETGKWLIRAGTNADPHLEFALGKMYLEGNGAAGGCKRAPKPPSRIGKKEGPRGLRSAKTTSNDDATTFRVVEKS